MGSHTSKQSVATSTSLITKSVLDVTQDCMQIAVGKQVMKIDGSDNVFKGNTQTASMKIDAGCMDRMSQDNNFSTRLNDTIAQKLKDQTVAGLGWMDPGGDDQSTSISQNITSGITFTDVQKCLSEMNNTQLMVVSGSDNVVADNLQEQSMSIASKCIMGGSQTADVSNDVTNTVNQHSDYDAENPFAFITDAIESTISSSMAILAIAFISIVILVLVFKIVHKHKKKDALQGSEIISPPGPSLKTV